MSGTENLEQLQEFILAAKKLKDDPKKMEENIFKFRQTVGYFINKWDTAKKDETVLAKKDATSIHQQFVVAGNLAIANLLPRHISILMEVDGGKPHIFDIKQYDSWISLAQKQKQNTLTQKEIIDNIRLFKNFRLKSDVVRSPVYGVMPSIDPITKGYVPNPAVPTPYGSIPGDYGSLKVTPPETSPGYGQPPKGFNPDDPYGTIPEGYNPNTYGQYPTGKTRAAVSQLSVVDQRQLRIELLKMRVAQAPLKVAQINVDHGTILLQNEIKVTATIASVLNQTRVESSDKLVPFTPLLQPYILVANRSFAVDEVVAYYDGRLVSAEHARAIEVMSPSHALHTLRAGKWAVVGYDDPNDVPRNGGLGSFAADNIDLCATARTQRECRIPHTTLNTQLMTLTDVQNSLAGDEDYKPERAFLVLVATRPIAKNQAIFYRHVSFSSYLLTDDDNDS